MACTLEDRCENQTKRKSARAIPLGDFGTIRSRPRRPELVPLSVSTRWSWAARPRQAPPPKVPRRVPRPKQPAHRTETRFGETRTPSRPLLLRLHLETMMAHHSRWQNLIRKKTSIKLPLLNALLQIQFCIHEGCGMPPADTLLPFSGRPGLNGGARIVPCPIILPRASVGPPYIWSASISLQRMHRC